MMKALLLLLFASAGLVICATPPVFVHPGVFLNSSDLSILKARLASGAEPQTSALVEANASPLSSLGYKVHGPPINGKVTCGPYDKPNIGCNNETADADAALLHAMLFILSGDVAHASLSRSIVNLYTSGLTGYEDSNAPLQAGWCGAKWVRVAELLRYTANSGWTEADTVAFTAMIVEIHLPLIYNGSGSNGNWELTMLDAMLGFSVFLEDAQLFNHTVTFWRQRTPASFYSFIIDGNQHAPFPPGRDNNSTSWYNQTVFNASTNGVCQETCRDFGHMQMGLGSCLAAAATARINGVDLFAEEAPRLTGAMEFAAGWLLKGESPTNPLPQQSPLLCSAAPMTLYYIATYEVGYRELAVRLQNELPLVAQLLKDIVRPLLNPDSLCSEWETLTHGEPL